MLEIMNHIHNFVADKASQKKSLLFISQELYAYIYNIMHWPVFLSFCQFHRFDCSMPFQVVFAFC